MGCHRPDRILALLALTLLAAGPASLLAAGPPLSATYTVSGASASGDSVHLTFAFSLRSGQPSDLTVEVVKLGNPSASDQAYATFQGGTIPAGGELKGSDSVTVPKSVYKKWKAGEPAALFVRTPGESGSAVWTRVDAAAAGPVH
jgi:hypothetical protein